PTGVKNSLFNNADFKAMVDQYYDVDGKSDWSDKEWKASDFNMAIDSLISYKNYNQIGKSMSDISRDIYAFSDVIRYGEDYYVFSYSTNHTQRQYFSATVVVVMQKRIGKW